MSSVTREENVSEPENFISWRFQSKQMKLQVLTLRIEKNSLFGSAVHMVAMSALYYRR
jgi:hypothetical protein